MPRTARSFALIAILALVSVVSAAPGASAVPLPGGTLDPLAVPKYVTPLVIPPVMPSVGADNYAIAVRQFRQQILPAGLPATTVWSYGNAADNVPALAPSPTSTFNYPALTIETTANTPVNVRWINGLVDDNNHFLPHLLPVDQTVHWANPPATGCVGGMGGGVDCRTDNAAAYTGPVPLITHVHGAHVDPHSDGYPQAWFLPAASDIPAGYSTKGSFFDDATGTNPGNLGYADFRYRNDQPAATLWYHDHALGMTRNNVYAGPAGFWLIRGGAYDGGIDNSTGLAATLPGPAPVAGDSLAALNTPGDAVRNAIREIPIAIQDRSFNADGSLFYPAGRAFFDGFNGPYTGSSPISTDIAPIANVEAFFNTMVVNGSTWPVMNAAPALYRFRLLNGCNSRMLNLSLRNMADNTELPVYQIGAEQGFLPRVVQIRTGFSTPLPGDGTIPAAVANPASPDQALLMGNAERADVIVDFRGLPDGTVVRMLNTGADSPFGGFPVGPAVADDNTTGQVMQFVIDNSMLLPADAGTTPPERLMLGHEPSIGAATVVRQVSLNEEESSQVCVGVDITGAITGTVDVFRTRLTPARMQAACAAAGGFPMAPRAPVLGKVDLGDPAAPAGIPLDWDDRTGTSAPVEVTMADGVTTKMVNVTENPVIVGGVAPIEEWEIYNFTMDAHPIHLHLVDFQVIGRSGLPGSLIPPSSGLVVQPTEAGFKDTVIAYPGEITRVRAKFDIEGLYVWHCHIVEHEDNEMMRPFVVSAADSAPIADVTLAASPAAASYKGEVVTFTAAATGGTGPYQYAFFGRKAGTTTWRPARSYLAGNTWSWNTATVAPGDYEFQAYARRQGSTAAYEAVSPVRGYTLLDPRAPETVALEASPADSAPRGTVVQFTATPGGGTGPYEFQFMGRAAGRQSFSIGRSYGASATWNWNTASVAYGNYEFQVYARAQGSTAPFEAISPSIAYAVFDPAAPTAATLDASPADNAVRGTMVTFAAGATGGTGPYEYRFLGRAAGQAAWKEARPYGTDNAWVWNTAGVAYGRYEWQACARRVGSPEPFTAVSPVVTYTIYDSNAASAATLSADNTAPTRGTRVTFTAGATGGPGPYLFQYQGRAVGSTSWLVAAGYTASTTWGWRTGFLDGPGNYEFRVLAKRQGSTAAFEAVSPTVTITVSPSPPGMTAQQAMAPDNSSLFDAVATAPDNSVYAVGQLRGSGPCTFGPGVTVGGTFIGPEPGAAKFFGTNAVIVKYDHSGVAQWAKTLGAAAGYSAFSSVSVDADGSVYAVGQFFGTDPFDFGDGVTFTGTSDYNYALVKYSGAGVPQWARGIGGMNGSYRGEIPCVAKNGAVYASGQIDGTATVDFGNGVAATGAGSAGNAVLVKFDGAGNAQWASTPSAVPTGKPSAYTGIVVGADNAVYAAGQIDGPGTFDFGPPGVPVAAAGIASINAVLVKFDGSGVAQWARTTTEGTDSNSARSVAMAADGSVYVAGWREGSADLNFGGSGNAATTIAGTNGRSGFLVKYVASGTPLWASTVATGASTDASVNFTGVCIDAAGKIYVSGAYIGVTNGYDFGNGVTLPANSFSALPLLVEYDGSGAARRVTSAGAGAGYYSVFSGVAISPDGSLYAAGPVLRPGPYDFGNGVTVAPVGFMYNAIVVRYLPGNTASSVTLAADGAVVTPGTVVTFTANAAGGTGSYEYEFRSRKAGVFAFDVARAYEGANTWAWDTTGVPAADYETKVYARIAGSGAAFEAVSALVTVHVALDPNPGSVSGAAQWLNTGDNNAGFTAVATAPDDSVYSAGVVLGPGACTFGPGVTVNGPYAGSESGGIYFGQNAVVVKYDRAGVAQWARTLVAGASDSSFTSVSVDADGSVYAFGYFCGTALFDFGDGVTFTGTADTSYVLVKYSGAGVAQWARGVGGTSGGYRADTPCAAKNGAVYAGGQIDGTATVDFGNGVTATGAGSGWNVVLVKFDGAGNAQWASTPSAVPAGAFSAYMGIAVGTDNTVYAAGSFGGPGTYRFGPPGLGATASGIAAGNTVLVRFDAFGDAQWAKTVKEGTDRNDATSVALAPDGSIYVAGVRYGSADLNFGGPGESATTIAGTNGDATGFLVRYDAFGTARWARSVATGAAADAHVEFNGLAAGADGSVYVSGSYLATTNAYDFGSGVTLPATGSGTIPLVMKYDLSGTAQWVKSPVADPSSSALINSAALSSDGYLYTAGFVSQTGTYDFGNGVTVNPPSIYTATLVKYR